MNLLSGRTSQFSDFSPVIGKRRAAFTLAEVVISVAIASIAVGGIIYGYVLSARRAEWSGYSLAANSVAMQAIERTRAAKWDPSSDPPVDLLTTNQFPTQWTMMDLPISGTNAIYATNYISITTVSTYPPLKMIRVDCVWPFLNGRLYTNTLVDYRSPQT